MVIYSKGLGHLVEFPSFPEDTGCLLPFCLIFFLLVVYLMSIVFLDQPEELRRVKENFFLLDACQASLIVLPQAQISLSCQLFTKVLLLCLKGVKTACLGPFLEPPTFRIPVHVKLNLSSSS